MNMNLRLARVRAQKPQLLLALEAGISQSLISQFELGYREPSEDQAKRIAKALGVKPKEIWGDDGRDPNHKP